MNKALGSFATIVAFSTAASVAIAEPVKLSKAELDKVVAGASSVNQQGHSPGTFPGGNPSTAKGQANNPSGK